jgi:hypothetical protein
VSGNCLRPANGERTQAGHALILYGFFEFFVCLLF